MFGDIVKVTPTSKVVGDMALIMVSPGPDGRRRARPGQRDVAFPESVVEMLHGDLGQPPGGFPPALQKKVLKGAEPLTARPGSLLEPTPTSRRAATTLEEQAAARPVDDDELASYLMYPKVFTDFARTPANYGPVAVLPTPVFFYGMTTGEEISVEIEQGKTLVVQLQAVGETDEDGQVPVFFELNGQPRVVQGAGPLGCRLPRSPAARPKPGNDAHVGAPMPGVVSTLAVQPETR